MDSGIPSLISQPVGLLQTADHMSNQPPAAVCLYINVTAAVHIWAYSSYSFLVKLLSFMVLFYLIGKSSKVVLIMLIMHHTFLSEIKFLPLGVRSLRARSCNVCALVRKCNQSVMKHKQYQRQMNVLKLFSVINSSKWLLKSKG